MAVKINDRFVGATSGNEYEAVMPNANAVISTETRSLGDVDVVTVKDVVTDGLPKTPEEAYEVLKGTIQAESKFLKSATYDSVNENYSTVAKNLKAEVGVNDVVKISGRKLSSNSNSMSYFLGEERGIVNGHYYKIAEETESNGGSTDGELKTVVADDKEALNSWEIKESDAKANSSNAGFVSMLLSQTFSESSSESFLNKSTSNYAWTNITVGTKVDTSNKFYTLTLTAYYGYNDRYITLDVVIDGDNFVNSALFVANDYNDDDIDSETKLPVEDATPKSTKSIEIRQERNYRHTIEKTDVNQYVTDDYDVMLSYTLSGQKEVTVDSEKMEVENSAKLAYKVRQKDMKKCMFLPNLVGAKEENAIVFDDGKPYLNKEGDVTLLFDNGLGVIKEVAVKSNQPKPYSLTTDLPSLIYSNESYNFHVAISPSAANQDATVTLKDGSECEATITKNEDGSFTIVATTNGNGTLVVSSAIDPNVKKEVSFTVETKPTADDVYNFLTTHTLAVYDRYNAVRHFINLNTDGTGKYVTYNKDPWVNEKGTVVSFTWKFNPDTFEISVTMSGTSDGYSIGRLFEATAKSVKFTYVYSSKEGDPFELTTISGEKLDLETATNLGSVTIG